MSSIDNANAAAQKIFLRMNPYNKTIFILHSNIKNITIADIFHRQCQCCCTKNLLFISREFIVIQVFAFIPNLDAHCMICPPCPISLSTSSTLSSFSVTATSSSVPLAYCSMPPCQITHKYLISSSSLSSRDFR